MLVYENTVGGLLNDIDKDQLVEKIERGFTEKGLGGISSQERDAQRNSFQFVYRALARSNIPENVGVAIEFKLFTNNRVDLILSGSDVEGNENIIVVELKQWEGENIEPVENKDGVVKAHFKGDSTRTHPCYQAWSYASILRDFNAEIQERSVGVYPIAYLHNYEAEHRDKIVNSVYEDYVDKAPLFIKGEVDALREYLEERLHSGDDGELLRDIAASELNPSESLQDVILDMIEGNSEFTLIGSQKIVSEEAITLAREANEENQKHVLIVEGEPGTGKTVVAVNLLVEYLQHDMTAQYVSKNTAPRDVYEQRLRDGSLYVKDINHLFTNPNGFFEAERNEIDALIADEAHRLVEKSFPWSDGENQIKEIINAAQFSVFFIDENQRVDTDSIGSVENIKKQARELDAKVTEESLDSQLRCAGSADYLTWLDDLLRINPAPSVRDEDLEYDIQLFHDPAALHEAIRQKDQTVGLSRVVAGYCWDWDSDHQDDADYVDIQIGDYERPWNRDDRDAWAIEEGSIDEVGCIHTTQGLEFEYVGVIIGPDLRMDDGDLVADLGERAGQDQSWHGVDDAEISAEDLVKNTYKTLLTRGMQGCYIYCCNDDLEEYICRRINQIQS